MNILLRLDKMSKIYIKKFKLLNKRWNYFRFKKCDNLQINEYLSSINNKNSYQLRKYSSKSVELPEQPFKKVVKLSNHIPQMTKIALKTYSNLQPHTAIQKYFLEMDPLTIATELPVRSSKYKVGGFIDILRYDKKNNICEIMDFKIGSDKYDVEKQLYKYKLCFEEIFDGKINCSYFTENEYIGINYK